MQETQVPSLGRKIPWRKESQPTPVFLPGEFLWTEEPGGLQPTGLQRLGHDWATSLSHGALVSITMRSIERERRKGRENSHHDLVLASVPDTVLSASDA